MLGLAAASTGAATAVVAGHIPALAAEVAENPELVRLGDQLPAVEAELSEATQAYYAIIRRWNPRMPRAPEAIAMDWSDKDAWERDILGAPILRDGSRYEYPRFDDPPRPPGSPRPMSVHTAAELERDAVRIERDMKRKRPRHPLTADQLLAMDAKRAMLLDKAGLARAYEAKRVAWLKASGFEPARARKEAAEKAMEALASSIMSVPETTMAGVLIKAQTLSLWHAYPLASLMDCTKGHALKLANSILRIAGEVNA